MSTHAQEDSQKNDNAAKAEENMVNNQSADNQAKQDVNDDQPNQTGAEAPKPANPGDLAEK